MNLPPYINLRNGLLAVLVIGVIILLVTLFKRNSSPNQDLVKQLIAAKDSVIASEKDKIALHERLIEEKDRTVAVLQQRDSVLNAHYNESEKLYRNINDKIKTIPDRVAALASNNDSLRRAYSIFE